MQYKLSLFLQSYLCGVLLCNSAYAKPPENLSCAKQSIIMYYQSGKFETDVSHVVKDAEKYLLNRIDENNNLPKPHKLAVILDIDETSLSNFVEHKKHDFAELSEFINDSYLKNDATVIKPVLQLYNMASRSGVDVFFVSSRPNKLRAYTIKTLQNVGYVGWKGLYLPNEEEKQIGSQKYKTNIRKILIEKGYDIVLNVGDQDTDLIGGYAERTYKIPNPMYSQQCKDKQLKLLCVT